ncbi:ABC transporter ATP-binding protein [Alsobacter sp. R-9]
MSQPFELRIARKDFRTAGGATVEVLREVALDLPAGSVTALVGPSGSGKTTLLHILLGLDRDFEGSVTGRPERIGVVFQEPRLLPWRTVRQNLDLATSSMGAPPADAALLAALGIADAQERYPAELSLGMARRASLARALAIRPDLLVLDEPFVSLDEATAARMRELVGRVIRERPVTTLLVSHDLDDALALADRVVVLAGRPARVGRIVELPAGEARDRAALATLRQRLAG